MFANRLVQIVSNVDTAVQCLADDYYRSLLWPTDLFDKVSDLKRERDIQGFLFLFII